MNFPTSPECAGARWGTCVRAAQVPPERPTVIGKLRDSSTKAAPQRSASVQKNLLESNEDLLQRGLSFEKLSTRVTHPGASQHGPRSSDESAARSREAARGNVDEKEEARRTENALGCLGSLK